MSLVMIILLVGISLMSYKVILLSVLLLIFLNASKILPMPARHPKVTHTESSFMALALFAVVFTLWTSRFFYDQFIPAIGLAVEGGYTYSSGFEKIFSGFFHRHSDPLSEYYVTSSTLVFIANLLWNALAVLGFIGGMVGYARSVLRGGNVEIGRRVFFAVAAAGSLDFLIYGTLGHQGLEFIVFSGLLGYCVVSGFSSQRGRETAILCVSSLLVINCLLMVGSAAGEYTAGPRDPNHFEYMNTVGDWYVEHGRDCGSCEYATDVLTYGFILKSVATADSNATVNIVLFARSHLAFLLVGNLSSAADFSGAEERFIINYRAQYFLTTGWEVYESWSNYRSRIEAYPQLSIIFSSGDFDVLVRR